MSTWVAYGIENTKKYNLIGIYVVHLKKKSYIKINWYLKLVVINTPEDDNQLVYFC